MALSDDYYCELCNRTLQRNTNIQEHRVGMVYQGLLKALL
jgi:hypothetical protein